MYDVLIVGAGPSGLCAAKTYLECEPNTKLLLVDENKTVGGVWAEENLYPGLKTNNLRGSVDYTDFPMHDGFGIPAGDPVTGEVMHGYLKAYAQRWNILERIEFETQVLEISRLDQNQGWELKVRSIEEKKLQTRKLIIATGITNSPHRPELKGSKDFSGPIIHSAELGKKGDLIIEKESIQKVAVIGGGKSAYDSVYLAACEGREVEWIMRKSGKGPNWVFPSHTNLGPFKIWREKLVLRRIVSFFSPFLWQDGFNWIRYFLHGTAIGKKIAQKFWKNLHAATLDECGYAKEKTLNTLEPETSPFWYGTASGVYNYDRNLYSFIRSGQVQTRREDISHLSSIGIHLADGNNTILPVDAIITATGFSAKPTMAFNPSTIHSDLGIPTTSLTPSQRDFWRTANHKAELTIVSQFPRLLIGPFKSPSSSVIQPYNPGIDPDMRYTPYRLYRAIAPPGLTVQGDRSLVFVGMFSNIANTIRLELQCLWAYAYLSGEMDINGTTVFDEAALLSRYSRYRSPYGHGRFFPDLVFDQLPYFDMLMQDLGLPFWRKGNIFREVFEPYGQDDYRGLVGEWLENRRKVRMREKTRENGKTL